MFGIRRRYNSFHDMKNSGLQRGLNPVLRSNQLSYEATDIGSWSFVGSLRNCKLRS